MLAAQPPQTAEEKIKVLQGFVQEFQQIQVQLRKLERAVMLSSPYAAQSNALLALQRWVDKADRVLQGIRELKL